MAEIELKSHKAAILSGQVIMEIDTKVSSK